MALRPSERAMHAAYLEYAESMECRAETATNGVLWNAAGVARLDQGKIRAWDLFVGPWEYVSRYMSEELREWFGDNGRMTYTEYREQMRAFNRDCRAEYNYS